MTGDSRYYRTDDGHLAPTEAYLRARLQNMDPDTFEHFVADVWERLGWATRVVGEPGDRGIDVIATADTGEGGRQKHLIQAKRYGPSTTVGSPEVQQYASLRMQEDGVDAVLIVTTGGFSRQAEDMAPDLGVRLVDGEEFLDIVTDLDALGLFADYFDEIVRHDTVDPRDEPATDDGGGWLDWLPWRG